MYVLRASPPAAGPLKVTSNRWLVISGRFYRIGGCLDRLSVSLFGPGHALGSSGGLLDHMVSAFAVRGWFSNDFGDLFWKPGAPFSY